MLNDKIQCDDAYWVQGIRYNLLSVSQLNNIGHKLEFHNRKVKIFDDDGNSVGNNEKTKGNLFFHDLIVHVFFLVKLEDLWLWHKRLCHVNFESIVKVSRKKRVRGLPNIHKTHNVMCKQC